MREFIWLYVWVAYMVKEHGYDFDIAFICAKESMKELESDWLIIDPRTDADEWWFNASYIER